MRSITKWIQKEIYPGETNMKEYTGWMLGSL